MIESELFGIAKGTATGVDAHDGKLSAADNGTLFWDEIGDMPLELQAKVLRAVEYQSFHKVGSNFVEHTDVRFVYATNQNIQDKISKGTFRRDLYYRISTFCIEIPPLRDRSGDIELLFNHFASHFSSTKASITISAQGLKHLEEYRWPGNVRELRNMVERLSILYPGQRIDIEMLPSEIFSSSPSVKPSKNPTCNPEIDRIKKALVKSRWNQSQAALELGIPLSTFRHKMKKHKISK